MVSIDKLRGYDIELHNGEWIYCDTKEPTASTWMNRPCGYCGMHNTPEGHDGCLGTLPNVMNACCGHGDMRDTYLQYHDGTVIRGEKAALEIQRLIKCNRKNKHTPRSKSFTKNP